MSDPAGQVHKKRAEKRPWDFATCKSLETASREILLYQWRWKINTMIVGRGDKREFKYSINRK